MPPTLRSAQSSPASKRPDNANMPSHITPGRKVPKCTKCGRLRQGHPRSGCPYSESPAKDAESSSAGIKPKTLQENLSEALGSMYLDSTTPPATDDKGGARAVAGNSRKRRSIATPPVQISETLASISTSAEDMLSDLVKPAFFSQATVLEDDGPTNTPTRVRIKSGPQTLMPGTLIAPSWESSIGGSADAGAEREADRTPQERVVSKSSLAVQALFKCLDGEAAPLALPQFPSQRSVSPRPLERPRPMEWRDQFPCSLVPTSPVSVYVYKQQDIDEVKASAKALGLEFCIIDIKRDEDNEEALLVIGSDPQAVQKLGDEIGKTIEAASTVESKGNTTTNNFYITNVAPTGGIGDVRSPSSSSTLKAVAGGAIVGAVGTWAGLAFS